jgi:RNA polymerase sigma-70 factor (ECF subfamily)
MSGVTEVISTDPASPGGPTPPAGRADPAPTTFDEFAADEFAPDEFAAWVRPHLPAMAALAARLSSDEDRDDVVQEALVRAWRRRSTYDGQRGTPRAWLLAIVADRARRVRTRARPAQILLDVGAPADDRDALVDLDQALRDLPPRQRLAVELFYFVGLDISDTADVMACSTGTVKSTLYDARLRLRALLGDEP